MVVVVVEGWPEGLRDSENISGLEAFISIIFEKEPSLTLASLSKKSTSSSIGIKELLSSVLNVRLLLEPLVLRVPQLLRIKELLITIPLAIIPVYDREPWKYRLTSIRRRMWHNIAINKHF